MVDAKMLNELNNKYNNYNSLYAHSLELLERKLLELQDEKEILDTAAYNLSLNKKSLEVMKVLIEKITDSSIGLLKNLLTVGFNTVFEGKYSVDIQVDDRGKDKTAEFYLIENSTGLRTMIKDDNGGGIKVILSFILRVFFIYYLKYPRFIILDEAFTELSKEYIEGLFAFFDILKKDLGFKYLFITHDIRFMNYADKILKVTPLGSIATQEQ